ncbi:MAG TPA: hypothetical protein VIZ67_02495 [Acidimicrobiales bacterium]|jgi:hypothetical protein
MRRMVKATTLMAAPALLATGLLAACDDGGSTVTAGSPNVAATSPAPPARAPTCGDSPARGSDPEVGEFLPGSRRVPVR